MVEDAETLQLCDHVTHMYRPGSFFARRQQHFCAICKNTAGICSMLEGDDLVRTAEQHLVVAHDAASAHGADADLLGVALLAHRGTVVNIMICAVVLFVDASASIRAVPLGASSLLWWCCSTISTS